MNDERVFMNGRYMTENEAIEADTPVCTRAEFETLQKQVAEIHAFLNGIAQTLKNPMVAAMLPPNMREMISRG